MTPTEDRKTAFVTGATGFLGLTLVEELIRRRWQVTALHRPRAILRFLQRFPVTLVEGDVTDPASLHAAMPVGVTAVFHVAGNTSLWAAERALQDQVNIAGTQHMVDVALARGAGRFIHTSSVSAYGFHEGRIDETAEQRGGASWINYMRSKYEAEGVVRSAITRGLDAVIMNPTSVIGAYDVQGWARMIRMVHTGTLPGVPPGAQTFCHAPEVMRAHIAAVERGRCGENYILGGTDASFLEVVRVIGEVIGCPVPHRATPAWVLRILGRIGPWRARLTGRPPQLTPEAVGMVTRHLFADTTKAEQDLGYHGGDLHTMIAESYDWLRREGLLAHT